MYTKFIKTFNSFFGKKGNYIFSGILIIFSLILISSSMYAFYNLIVRNSKYVVKYVSFKDNNGYYIDSSGETEVTFLSYADGKALNPNDYNGKILKMYCAKNERRNCFYIKGEYNFEYVLFGIVFGCLLLSLGIVFRKLYKIRNINYGTIRVFRPFLILLFLFGAYLFTYQMYNLVNYMRFDKSSNVVNGNVIGIYDNNYLVHYVVDDNHYSNLVKIPDKMKHNTIDIKYSKKNPSFSLNRNECNYFLLVLGIIVSYLSIYIMLNEKVIDKQIKVSEKRSKKEGYRRNK